MKYKLEAKDMDIKELKKMVKMKQEELSEMQASLSHWLTQRDCLNYRVREQGHGEVFLFNTFNYRYVALSLSLVKDKFSTFLRFLLYAVLGI